MSSIANYFAVFLPLDMKASPSANDFMTTIGSLAPFAQNIETVQTTPTNNIGQYSMVFGLLTDPQATTALTALNTLNTVLVAAGDPVVTAYTYKVTLEP